MKTGHLISYGLISYRFWLMLTILAMPFSPRAHGRNNKSAIKTVLFQIIICRLRLPLFGFYSARENSLRTFTPKSCRADFIVSHKKSILGGGKKETFWVILLMGKRVLRFKPSLIVNRVSD